MSPEPTDVVLTASVVSFDGRVLELFGHASRLGNRVHVAQITAIDDGGDTVTITVRGGTDYSIVLSGEGEATRAEVESLVAAVRAAASLP
jgi:acyl-coenzyme A thioesterase PaaI-like protein